LGIWDGFGHPGTLATPMTGWRRHYLTSIIIIIIISMLQQQQPGLMRSFPNHKHTEAA